MKTHRHIHALTTLCRWIWEPRIPTAPGTACNFAIWKIMSYVNWWITIRLCVCVVGNTHQYQMNCNQPDQSIWCKILSNVQFGTCGYCVEHAWQRTHIIRNSKLNKNMIQKWLINGRALFMDVTNTRDAHIRNMDNNVRCLCVFIYDVAMRICVCWRPTRPSKIWARRSYHTK